MFDALAEIFKLFDATFRIDDDGYLDIEYFNEHDKIELPNTEKAGYSSSLGEERFANRLVSYFQNTKVNDRFPNSNNDNATVYVRSKTLGVPDSKDYGLITPKPIDYINKISFIGQNKRTIQMEYTDIYWIIYSPYPLIDISKNVIEEEIWASLPTYGDVNNPGRRNSFSYKRGSNCINVSETYVDEYGYTVLIADKVVQAAINRQYAFGDTIYHSFFVPPGTILNFRDMKFAIDYVALVDGRLINESIDNKCEGEILVNQGNGSIDINKLGLNMVGLSLKLGQPSLTMTQKFTNWADRIKKGQFFMDGNDKWVANACSYVLVTNNIIQATIEFVKNFNGLASRIELDHEKRLSLISNDLTVKCEDNYGEFVYYGDNLDSTEIYNLAEEIALNKLIVANSIFMGFSATYGNSNVQTLDVSSRVVDMTMYNVHDVFTGHTYTKKQLVKINGYVKLPSDPELLAKGSIDIYDDPSLTGSYITLPQSSAVQSAIKLNAYTNEFDYDYDISETFPFDTTTPTSLLEDGDDVEICLIVDGTMMIGGVIVNGPDTGYYDITEVMEYVPTNTDRIEYALITALTEDNTVITNGGEEVKNIAIPMVVYGSGNSVCFEMSFDSPLNAGNRLLNSDGGWFSSSVLYCDRSGLADKFTIDFVKLQEETSRQFPLMKTTDGTRYLDTYSFGKIEEYGYYKKPNEIFALNYQIHFMPYIGTAIKNKQSFLSNEFIKNNGFANGLNEKILHIVYTTTDDDDDFEYSILDTKGHGTHEVAITGVSRSALPSLRNDFSIFFNNELDDLPNPVEEYSKIKTWAIVDDNNTIYYASNNTPSATTFEIQFFTRHHRLD